MKRRPSSSSQINSASLAQIDWHHDGVLHRVRLASSDDIVVFERQDENFAWERFEPDPMDECFVSAAMDLRDENWCAFVGELPLALQDYLRQFQFERLEALAVATQCPALVETLDITPALTLFLAAHVALRGTDGPRWSEINAVYERSGTYALLEWLGLPSTPQALASLGEIRDPEIPRHELSALRAGLWEGSGVHPLAA